MFFRSAADQGDPGGTLQLAKAYAPGHGLAQNDIEAARWYKAAIDNHREAIFALGLYSAAGRGVPKSEEQAACWYRIAAKQGNVDAMRALAEAYRTGVGVKADPARAAE
jgi:TPR repeat protein